MSDAPADGGLPSAGADSAPGAGAPSEAHPRHALDDLLTHAVRFSVMAALNGMERVEFALVRDSVQVSDSMLSKQVAQLERAGYVEVEKGKVGRRPRTWLSLTGAGERALTRHVAALRAIAGDL